MGGFSRDNIITTSGWLQSSKRETATMIKLATIAILAVIAGLAESMPMEGSGNATGTIQIGGTVINPKDILSQLSGVLSSLGDALYKIHPVVAEPLWQGSYYAEEAKESIPDNLSEIVKETPRQPSTLL